jgi:hypothetical protein
VSWPNPVKSQSFHPASRSVSGRDSAHGGRRPALACRPPAIGVNYVRKRWMGSISNRFIHFHHRPPVHQAQTNRRDQVKKGPSSPHGIQGVMIASVCVFRCVQGACPNGQSIVSFRWS